MSACQVSNDRNRREALQDVIAAGKLFIKREYKQFPVMAEDRLVGQIRRIDVLKALEALRHEKA